ncbi:MAG: hypothetical protein ACQEXJ_02600 [Myxococcota bacterium]
MSRIVCSRVACLRIPWFPIDVLRRDGRAGRGSPAALVRGSGSHARVALVEPRAAARGLQRGLTPAQARAIAPGVDLIPWDEDAEAAVRSATDAVAAELSPLSPRVTPVAPGTSWLEPVDPDVARGLGPDRGARGEEAFAREAVARVERAGYPGARVGLADAPVAAAAATRVGGRDVLRVEPGGDKAFLAGLPIAALPLSDRTRRLLRDLGIHRIGALQAMGPGELEARFGPEGRHAWRAAQGMDPRRPITPRPHAELRVTTPLVAPAERSEALLFVLRPVLERMIGDLAGRRLAVGRLRLTLERAWGEPVRLDVAPGQATADDGLLLELARLRLAHALDEGGGDGEGGPVVGLSVEVLRTAPLRPRQGDLFTARWIDPVAAESALLRLTGRFGEQAVARAERRDDHRPERAGRWRPVVDETGAGDETPGSAPVVREDLPPACLRMLDPPEPVRVSEDRRRLLRTGRGRTLSLGRWHGPERLSGRWWEGAWDREYWWVVANEGRILWLYRDPGAGRWYLHGWLD